MKSYYSTHGERVAFGVLTQLVLEEKHYSNQFIDTTNRKDEINVVLKFCTTVGLPVTLKELSIDGTDEKVLRAIAQHALGKNHEESIINFYSYHLFYSITCWWRMAAGKRERVL